MPPKADPTTITDPATSGQPITRSKILPRDLSHLRGLTVAARKAYLMLTALSDSGGRLLREDPRLALAGITPQTLSRLDSAGLIARYRHNGLNVLFVPGGKASSGFSHSRLAPQPDDLPSKVPGLGAGSVLYAGLDEVLADMDPLEASVWHILLCLADSYGRGLFAAETVTDALGRVRLPDNRPITRQLVTEAFQRLHDHGFLQAYTAKRKPCYAILDAKQLYRRMPGAKAPPPEGLRWDWSFDSQEGLAWRAAREARFEQRKQKKVARKAAAAERRAAKETKAKEDPTVAILAKLDKIYAHPKPHLEYICGRTDPAVYVCHAVNKLPGLDVGLVQIALSDLRNQPECVHYWVFGKTNRLIDDLEREYCGMITLTPGVEKTEKPRKIWPSHWSGPLPPPVVGAHL